MNANTSLNLTRELFVEANGKTLETKVVIQSLEIRSENKWLCNWSIPYLCERGAAFGSDPIEALITCLKIISTFLQKSQADGIRVHWKVRGDNAGFPKIE